MPKKKKGNGLPLPDPNVYASDTLELLFTQDIGFDAVITCRGEEFRIHKSLAAVRSRFMKVAFYGGFKEASESKLSADDFEVDVVREMIHHLYHGTYTSTLTNDSFKPRGVQEVLAQVENYWSAPSKQIRKEWADQARMREMGAAGGNMLFHVKMHNIADYYQIDSLASYAFMNIRRLLAERWDLGLFIETLRLCWNNIVHDVVRKVFATTAAPHLDELLASSAFNELDCRDAVVIAAASRK